MLEIVSKLFWLPKKSLLSGSEKSPFHLQKRFLSGSEKSLFQFLKMLEITSRMFWRPEKASPF
jgi:hypothetical protein